MSHRELHALGLASLLVTTGAFAHGLDRSEAEVVVSADRVAIASDVDEGMEDAAVAALIVRDGEGHRLAGRVASTVPSFQPGHVLVRVEYPLAEPPRWLSFQLSPDPPALPLTRRQSLTVTDRSGPGAREPRLVTVTSGGNVEALRFGAPEPEATCGPGLLDRHPERLQGVQAMLRDDGTGMRLDVIVPFGILETWLPIPRADRDVLGVAEQRDALAAAAALVASRVRVMGEGSPVQGRVTEATWLGLDDLALGGDATSRARDVWTARVRVTLHFPERGRLAWDLWNARVLTADVVVLDGGRCETRRLSTYAAEFP